jgi:signal transduction histidine kinase
MDIIDIILLSIAVITTVLTAIVLLNGWKNPTNKAYALFLIACIGWPLVIALFRLSTNMYWAYFCVHAIYIEGLFAPITFLYFSAIISDHTEFIRKTKIYICITAGILLYFLFFTPYWVKSISISNNIKTVTMGPVYIVWMIFYMVFMTWGMIILFQKMRTVKGYKRTQLLLVLLSTSFPILGSVIPNVIWPLMGNYNHIYAGPFGVTPMNVIVVYAIIRHKFMDIRLMMARVIGYALLVIIMSLAYGSAILFSAKYLFQISLQYTQIIILTAISLFISLTLKPLRNVIEKITKNVFYKGHYDTDQLIYQITQIVATNIELNKLTNEVLNTIRDKMQITHVTAIILDKFEKFIIETAPGITPHLGMINEELDILTNYGKQIIFDELPDCTVKTVMRKHDIAVFLPLTTTHRTIGYLILSDKSSGDSYYHQDINTLQILAPELAVAFENAQSYEEIKQFNSLLQDRILKATEGVRNANQKLMQLDRMKDEFVAEVSHDLRTPLSTIKGYSWMLMKQKESLKPDQIEDVSRIYNSSERMIALIDDMLDLSRIEGGRMELVFEKLNLMDEVKHIQEDLTIRLSEKQLQFEIKNDLSNLDVKSDRNRLHEVLMNLVDNAIKYTPNGGKIVVEFKNQDKYILTNISDSGVGINEADFSKLFTKFGRIKNNLAQVTNVRGTGLGLYICKRIIELSGGTIEAKSYPGKGSDFFFTLPKYTS